MEAKIDFPPELINELAEQISKRVLSILKDRKIDDEIFDLNQLCDYLKVTKAWVYERTHLNEIPYIKLNGHLRFRRSKIDSWLENYNMKVIRLRDERLI